MLTFTPYASGSTGNLYHLTDGETALLIECGLPIREIRLILNFQLSVISGCLITHDHKDHSMAAADIMKAGIDCYMTQGTADVLGLSGHRLKIIRANHQFRIGTWTVLPFEAEHDAAEPVGFLMQSGPYKMVFLTDSFFCRYKFKGLTHIALEVNYHLPILTENLAAGVVPLALKNRILNSHFSLDNVKEFLMANDLSGVLEIHLIHLSSTNGDPVLFRNEIQRLTGKPTFTH